jgi:tetratricopeptide (TPR) repeat protein
MSTRVPVIQQISWPAVLLHLAIGGSLIGIAALFLPPSRAVMAGALVYLIYAWASRAVAARHHQRGMRLVRSHRFAEAIEAFEASYAFFSRQQWLDRYRSVFLLSPSGISYREMALVNIAFSAAQLGDGARAKAYYQRALQEFPQSGIATAALNIIAAAEKRP